MERLSRTPPLTATEPCPIKNKIKAVHILNGDDNTYLTENGSQHVNLPREAKYVDGDHIANLDRLGREIRIKVEFERPKEENFKVVLLSHKDNVDYTDEEKGRRDSFKYERADAEHKQGDFTKHHGKVLVGNTDKNGIAIVDDKFKTTPVGGDRYMVVAWDVHGNVVFSNEIITKRTLFYATFLGNDPNQVSVPQQKFKTGIEAAYAPYHIELVCIGTETLNDIVYHDTLWQITVPEAVRQKAETAASLLRGTYASYAPFLIKFVFVDHSACALRKEMQPFLVEGANPGDVITAPIYMATPDYRKKTDENFDWRKCLWRGLGQPLEPFPRTTTGHEWFESASLTFYKKTFYRKFVKRVVSLKVDSLTPVARKRKGPEGIEVEEPEAMVELSLKLPSDLPPNTDVTLNAELVYVNQSVLGQSMTAPYADTTIQPARHMFVPVDHDKQVASAIHEFGHGIGMVANVDKQGVGHDMMYSHNGCHCRHGIDVQADAPDKYHKPPLKDKGDCVMYGLIPPKPNMAFCEDCAKVLRKLDLSAGFTPN